MAADLVLVSSDMNINEKFTGGIILHKYLPLDNTLPNVYPLEKRLGFLWRQ
jgi:hypothetical protein